MIDLNMKPIDKALYLQYEAEVLNHIELGILTKKEAAEVLDNYLKALGY